MSTTPASLPVRQWRDVITPEAGTQLAVAGWIPTSPRAIVLISHGHNEHLGRYGHVINVLVADGYAVYGLDHRGHGRSTGHRALIEDFDRIAQDMHELTLYVKREHEGLPVVLIGHSMGGLIALRYTLRYQDHVDALVTSGPALVIDHNTPDLLARAAQGIGNVVPAVETPQGASRRCGLSTDPWVCQQAKIDHLVRNGNPLLGTVAAMLRSAEDTCARLGEIRLPLLAMHGAEDGVTHPRGTQLLSDHAGSGDKTVVFWEGMRHEIFNEVDRARVIDTLRRWLNDRIA